MGQVAMKPESGDDPYAPPRADPVPGAAGAIVQDSGSLWRVVDGKLQVRHMASLPDICVDGGPEDEAGQRYTQVMTRVPEWLNGGVWLAVGISALLGWLRLNLVIVFLFAVWNAVPLATNKKPQVHFFRAKPASRFASSRSWLWLALYVGVIGAAFYFASGRSFTDAGGTFNVIILLNGGLALSRLLTGKGFGQARQRKDDWFELKGIAPAAIARLEELQQRMPPRLEAPSSNGTS